MSIISGATNKNTDPREKWNIVVPVINRSPISYYMQLYAIIIVVVPQKLAAPISLYMCVFFGDKLSRIIQDNSAVLTAGDGERVPSLPFPRLSL